MRNTTNTKRTASRQIAFKKVSTKFLRTEETSRIQQETQQCRFITRNNFFFQMLPCRYDALENKNIASTRLVTIDIKQFSISFSFDKKKDTVNLRVMLYTRTSQNSLYKVRAFYLFIISCRQCCSQTTGH